MRAFTTTSGVWSIDKDYIYRGTSLLASENPTPGSRLHYHLDHLGSPRLITNASGSQMAFHAYLPFGEEATPFNQDDDRTKFTGHERDPGNPNDPTDDLDYMHARFHSPVLNRFLSPDKFLGVAEQPQSWNRYAYTRNNPLKYTDPTGNYIVNCQPDDKQCLADAAAFEAARLLNLESEDEAVKAAASVYGEPETDNGITVVFDYPADEGAVTEHNFKVDGNTGVGAYIGVARFESGKDGTALAADVAHEGQHIKDAKAFVASIRLNGNDLWWDLSLNPTHRETGTKAYQLTHAIYKQANMKFRGEGGTLGRGVRKDRKRDRQIRKILENPNGRYKDKLDQRVLSDYSGPPP